MNGTDSLPYLNNKQKAALAALTILLMLLISSLAAARWLLRAFPQINGTLQLAGLDEIVEVRRDEWGVPYIYAKTQHDLFFAQGVVHAQDRLWQMDYQRRKGLGRLSTLLGEQSIQSDRFFRTIGISKAAERDWERLSAEGQAALIAYAEGVNAYVNQHPILPLEYQWLGVGWEPWQPLHTLAALKVMQWEFDSHSSGNWQEELLRAQLIEQLGASKAALLFSESTISPQSAQAWLIEKKNSPTGHPILVNLLYTDSRIPTMWYQMGLHGAGFHVVGAGVAGIPTVLMGHNADLAWGISSTSSDVQDLFIEHLNQSQQAYEWQGEMLPLTVRHEEIQVKDQPPVSIEIKETHHGVLLNEVVDDLEQPTALQWEPPTNRFSAHTSLMDALISINLAQSTQPQPQWGAETIIIADINGKSALPSAWQTSSLRHQALGDITSSPAQKLVPLLTKLSSDDIIVQRVQEQLRAWNYQMAGDLPGATIYAVTRQQILHHLLTDEFPASQKGQELLETYLSYHHQNLKLLMQLLDEPNNPLWDNKQTVPEERRDDILLAALEEATDWLGRHFGDVPHEWAWKRLHIATFEHPLSTIKPLERIFNRAISIEGDSDTQNASYPPDGKSYRPTRIASYRQQIEVGAWENSGMIYPTGQSGQPFHPHYNDMLEAWQEGRILPMLWSQEQTKEASEGRVLKLVP